MFQTTYASKMLPLSPREANCASDVWRRQVARRQGGSRFVRATRRVWLRPVWNHRVSGRSDLRLATGIAWCRANPVRFHLEVSEWSGDRTVLALRPRRFRRIETRATYGTLVRETLQTIAAELVDLHAKEGPTHLRLVSDGSVHDRHAWRYTGVGAGVRLPQARISSDGALPAMTR